MPKLDKKTAKQVDDAESSFELLEPGMYIATLAEVTVSDAEGDSGFHYWRWRFNDIIDIESDEKKAGSQWVNTSLSPKAAWKLQEVFQAFGVGADTDTDELLGQQVQLAISQQPIQSGPKTGQLSNQVDSVLPLGADD